MVDFIGRELTTGNLEFISSSQDPLKVEEKK